MQAPGGRSVPPAKFGTSCVEGAGPDAHETGVEGQNLYRRADVVDADRNRRGYRFDLHGKPHAK